MVVLGLVSVMQAVKVARLAKGEGGKIVTKYYLEVDCVNKKPLVLLLFCVSPQISDSKKQNNYEREKRKPSPSTPADPSHTHTHTHRYFI